LPGTVHHVLERPTLEKLPVMRRDLLPHGRYMMDSIFTTRGCPNHCRFCPVTDIFGAKIRCGGNLIMSEFFEKNG
jgi:radical SAM superfamily enzyme YgiQ (UPF0313 family)